MKNKLMILTVAFTAMSNSLLAENSRFSKNYWESRPRTFSTPFPPRIAGQPNNIFEKALVTTNTSSVSPSGLNFKGPLNYKPADMRVMTKSMKDTFWHMFPYQNKLDKAAKGLGCNIGAIHASSTGKMIPTPTPVAFMPGIASSIPVAATMASAALAPAILTAAAMPAFALATTALGYKLLQFPELVLDEAVTPENKNLEIDKLIQENVLGNVVKDKNPSRFESFKKATVTDHPYATAGVGLAAAAGIGYLAYQKYGKTKPVVKAAANVVAPAAKPVVAQQPAPVKKAKRNNARCKNGRCGKRK